MERLNNSYCKLTSLFHQDGKGSVSWWLNSYKVNIMINICVAITRASSHATSHEICEFRIHSTFIERPSVIPGTSKHEKFNWFIFFINLSLEHLKSLEAKKSVYNFGKQKSPFFFNSFWKLLYELIWISTCLCVTYKCSSIISIYY